MSNNFTFISCLDKDILEKTLNKKYENRYEAERELVYKLESKGEKDQYISSDEGHKLLKLDPKEVHRIHSDLYQFKSTYLKSIRELSSLSLIKNLPRETLLKTHRTDQIISINEYTDILDSDLINKLSNYLQLQNIRSKDELRSSYKNKSDKYLDRLMYEDFVTEYSWIDKEYSFNQIKLKQDIHALRIFIFDFPEYKDNVFEMIFRTYNKDLEDYILELFEKDKIDSRYKLSMLGLGYERLIKKIRFNKKEYIESKREELSKYNPKFIKNQIEKKIYSGDVKTLNRDKIIGIKSLYADYFDLTKIEGLKYALDNDINVVKLQHRDIFFKIISDNVLLYLLKYNIISEYSYLSYLASIPNINRLKKINILDFPNLVWENDYILYNNFKYLLDNSIYPKTVYSSLMSGLNYYQSVLTYEKAGFISQDLLRTSNERLLHFYLSRLINLNGIALKEIDPRYLDIILKYDPPKYELSKLFDNYYSQSLSDYDIGLLEKIVKLLDGDQVVSKSTDYLFSKSFFRERISEILKARNKTERNNLMKEIGKYIDKSKDLDNIFDWVYKKD